jgi:hypothetical protein
MKLIPTILALGALALTSVGFAQSSNSRQPSHSARPRNAQSRRSGSISGGQVIIIYAAPAPSAYGQAYGANAYGQSYSSPTYSQPPATYPTQANSIASANYSQPAYSAAPAQAYTQPYTQPPEYTQPADPVTHSADELHRAEQMLLAAQRVQAAAQTRLERARAAHAAATAPVTGAPHPAPPADQMDPGNN